MHKIILLTSCFAAVIADTLLVFYAKSKTHHLGFIIAGIALTNVAAVVWAYSMKKGIESSIAITFYALFTVAACSAIGFFVFKEDLSMMNGIGIFLALIALVMISL
jgi:multidrug transporter EmrE-like cation transporter